ncbi:Acetylornithine/succinyldiaminopimelate aminotransferase [Streptomyces glaucescens]
MTTARSASQPSEPAPSGTFDLAALLAERGAERYELHARYLNHQLPRMLHTIGFDKVYERAEGAYFWDADGDDYLDMLAGFGVMGLGRHHPVVRKALHDVLDADLADLTRFDCQTLPGLLAERLLAHSPHLDRVFFGNSGTEAVETALKFARYVTGRPRVLYRAHAFHGLTTGSLSVNESAPQAPGCGTRPCSEARRARPGLKRGYSARASKSGLSSSITSGELGRGGAAAPVDLVATVLGVGLQVVRDDRLALDPQGEQGHRHRQARPVLARRAVHQGGHAVLGEGVQHPGVFRRCAP